MNLWTNGNQSRQAIVSVTNLDKKAGHTSEREALDGPVKIRSSLEEYKEYRQLLYCSL